MSKTALYNEHLKAGAKMVDFAGWQMPIHYGSQLEEHHKVRQDVGMFDVSHMAVIDVRGTLAKSFLRFLLANDVDKLQQPGKALYTCMLNERGGIIDDLIVYYIEPENYRLVVNAATREKDLEWLNNQASAFNVFLSERNDLGIIAVQGPNATEKLCSLFSTEQQETIKKLKTFQGTMIDHLWIARTGYTGEEGYEIIVPVKQIVDLWQRLLAAGVSPCGLGARDTLRLEAGLNLYGTDMDENTTPLESNLAWTIAWEPKDRQFIGRKALEKQRQEQIHKELVGLVLESQGVLRNHQQVMIDDNQEGEITSGTFSPTLGKGIALARLPNHPQTQTCLVNMRGKWLPAKIVQPPFVRKGQILVK